MHEQMSLGGLLWSWVLLWWLVATAVVTIVAEDKGRSGLGYFLLALFLCPLFAALVLAGATDARLAKAVRADNDPLKGKDFREGIESLWKQLDVIRQQLASMQTAGVAIASPAAEAGTAPPPVAARPIVASGMGYCPGCQRLRGMASTKCIYCGEMLPAQPTR